MRLQWTALVLRALVAPVFLVSLAENVEAQRPGRDNYLHFIPPAPRIMGESAASARLHLYGNAADPGYRDADPRDGVDDRRAQRLLALGEHFSPILRRNTYNIPRDFEDVLGERVILHLDTWRAGERIASDSLDLGPPLTHSRPVAEPLAEPFTVTTFATAGSTGPPRTAPDDLALEALFRELHPRRMISNVIPPEETLERIPFFDVPGESVPSWRRLHGKQKPERTRIYLHPFIHEIPEPDDERRYEFLLQYWFYYPYNDGGNNHEGDWEHITVSVTTEEHASGAGADPQRRGLLSEVDLARLLDGEQPTPLDSLRIWYVNYYFHHYVMRVDYLELATGGTMWSRKDSPDRAIHIWEDTRYMDDAVRRRLELADGRLATHPIGYIGGNNKGTDELLHLWPRFGGSFNRDSHGTYPFPGVWRKVGPLDATEKILGDVVPRVHADTERPWYELIDDDWYLVYRAPDLILLPDWERLEDLMLEDPVVRRQWAWFLLPVHMGFPAVPSPGAGALRRVDLGNIAPMSPAYNTAWNRPGVTEVYGPYHPTVLSVMFAPISPLTSLKSGWGALNLPIVLWGLLPGGNVIVTQLLPWASGALNVLGAPPGRTLYQGELPDRFTSFGMGRHWQFGGHDFARLLPERTHPTVGAYLDASAPSDTRIRRRRLAPGWGNRLWFNLHYSERLSIENTLGYSESEVSYAVVDALERDRARVSGVLGTWELTGGLTYGLPVASAGLLRPYLRAGYGYTSYAVETVTLGGEPVPNATRNGGYMLTPWTPRTWWPNTLYGGIGVEHFSPTNRWLLRRVGYGARLEFTGLAHRLRTDPECDCHVSTERGDVALIFLLGW